MKLIFLIFKSKFKNNYFVSTWFLFLSFFSLPSHAYILSSIRPIAFITEAIADKVVRTEVLLPGHLSPHTYSLKPKDVERIKKAELIIWVGRELEHFIADLLTGMDKDKQIVLLNTSSVNRLIYRYSATSHTDHSIDSHIWLSPKIAKQIAIVIYDKLLALHPESRVQLGKNLTNFIDKLRNTEQIIAKKLINIQNKGYFVFHDAYGYFERQFGLKKLGYFTINPETQPGVKTVYAIRRQLVGNRAVCVFREPQFNPAIINKVIEGTGVRTAVLDPLASDVILNKDAYFVFLINLTSQFMECLSRDNQ